ncbi:hypothetical protein V6N13_102542 [Hibiscus sabdariffa]
MFDLDRRSLESATTWARLYYMEVSAGPLLLGLMMIIFRKIRRTNISTQPAEGSLIAFVYKDLQKATKKASVLFSKGRCQMEVL